MEHLLRIFLILWTPCLILALPQLVRVSNAITEYTACVVEYNTIVEALPANTLTENVNQYENITSQAKLQGADIIVFPEYGLTSTTPSINRFLAQQFSQIVPDVETNTIPCIHFNDTQVIQRLSCVARNEQIYLVVNLLERVTCLECSDDEKLLLYNTNVVFDRNGQVVAKYRKFNLFGETALNSTAEPDYSFFDSDFGARFGLITCFDILFERPSYVLVHNFSVTDVIIPSAWGQELPFLIGIQAQAGWSFSADVNLLASGYNNPNRGNTGSGIYGGLRDGIIETYISEAKETKSIISKVPSKRILQKESDTSFYNLVIKNDNLENFTSIVLKNNANPITLCHKSLCCKLSYEMNAPIENFYHLVVYDGFAKHASGTYINAFQVCGLVACSNLNTTSCSAHFNSSTYSLNTQFNHITLEASYFKSDRAWPNTLKSDNMIPLNIQDFQFEKRRHSINQVYYKLQLNTSISAIHTFSLFSEDFEKYNLEE